MRFILACILSLICVSGSAQMRGAFFEIGGSGGLGSVNLEMVEAPQEITRVPYDVFALRKYCFGYRIGFSCAPVDKNNGWVIVFPAMANIVYGTSKNKLEGGAGLAPSITTKGAFFVRSPLMLGYRRQNDDRKFYYRVDYTPIVSWLVDFQWEHWFGVSIGYKLS